MNLLPEEKLIWSAVVANSRMNRARKASGINSYEKEFKFKPEEYLEKKINENGKASWVDLCCGEGNALIQTAEYFQKKKLQDKIELTGIDLLDSFNPAGKNFNFLQFESMSVVDWNPNEKYDLITSVHGISYLGDKLKFLEIALGALNKDGLFIANLDLSNIKVANSTSDQVLKTLFKNNGIEYNAKTRILKRVGPVKFKTGLIYLGADDTTGPNYSGQEAVTSHYAIKNTMERG